MPRAYDTIFWKVHYSEMNQLHARLSDVQEILWTLAEKELKDQFEKEQKVNEDKVKPIIDLLKEKKSKGILVERLYMERVKKLLQEQNDLKTKSEIRLLIRDHEIRDKIEMQGGLIDNNLKKMLKQRHIDEKQIATDILKQRDMASEARVNYYNEVSKLFDKEADYFNKKMDKI